MMLDEQCHRTGKEPGREVMCYYGGSGQKDDWFVVNMGSVRCEMALSHTGEQRETKQGR